MAPIAVILAAGKSTRMKSKCPKALHEVCGKPMLQFVLDACYEAGCQRVLLVVGHGKDEIIAHFGRDERIQWVEQAEQLGTGHAARVCEPQLRQHHGDVFILTGDAPLIRGEVLRTLLRTHREEHANASMATAILDDPTGYGRVVRDAQGQFVRIVEQIDATPQEREIREVFPSYYCFKGEDLLFALSRLKNDNKKGEFYLTDTYGILRDAGKKVVAVQAVGPEDVLGVNDREQLAAIDSIMQDRIQRQVRAGGVTIASPVNTYIEAGVTIGPDTTIHPFTQVCRDSSIGADCTIGPFAIVPPESIVPEGSVVSGNVANELPLRAGGVR
ncbi:MAG TPA: NTP transferase domain-containing protein [Tepidisphaeraceae bacterium]|nr:NTP transferase domain-containing protein [Tepidisphaeraceae bacterium]